MYQREANIRLLKKTAVLLAIVLAIGSVGYLVYQKMNIGNYLDPCFARAEGYVQMLMDHIRNIPEHVPEAEPEQEPIQATAELQAVDFEELRKESPCVCGWIRIPALGVDYPVCWNGSNYYYLDHGWNDASSSSGAIFLEQKNRPDFSENYQVLFGHAMKDGTMFGKIEKYASEEFYRENGGIIYLYLPDETRVYQIFSTAYVKSGDASVYTVGFSDRPEFTEIFRAMKSRARYETGIRPDENSSVITLSPCEGETSRLVLHALLTDRMPSQ